MDSKTETVSDNELIARFMGQSGLTKVYRGKIVPYVPAYDALWDLLMPVVAKIWQLFNEMQAKNKDCDRADLDDHDGWRSWSYHKPDLDVDINAVYKETVDAIRWYNSQPPQQLNEN